MLRVQQNQAPAHIAQAFHLAKSPVSSPGPHPSPHLKSGCSPSGPRSGPPREEGPASRSPPSWQEQAVLSGSLPGLRGQTSNLQVTGVLFFVFSTDALSVVHLIHWTLPFMGLWSANRPTPRPNPWTCGRVPSQGQRILGKRLRQDTSGWDCVPDGPEGLTCDTDPSRQGGVSPLQKGEREAG